MTGITETEAEIGITEPEAEIGITETGVETETIELAEIGTEAGIDMPETEAETEGLTRENNNQNMIEIELEILAQREPKHHQHVI